MTRHSHLHHKWQDMGPLSSDGNALNHLRRYNFQITKGGIIVPPRGYELNREDWSAIDYLVGEWDYAYAPSPDQLPTDTAREAMATNEPGPRAPASRS